MLSDKSTDDKMQELLKSYFSKLREDDRTEAELEQESEKILSIAKEKFSKAGQPKSVFDTFKLKLGNYNYLAYSAAAIIVLMLGWYVFTQFSSIEENHTALQLAVENENGGTELLVNADHTIADNKRTSIKSSITTIDSLFLENTNAIKNQKAQPGELSSYDKAFTIIKEVLRSNNLIIDEVMTGYIVTGWYYTTSEDDKFVKSRLIAKNDPNQDNKVQFMIEKIEVDSQDINKNQLVDNQLYTQVVGQIKYDISKRRL